jgi:mycothiol synthase
MYTLPDGLTFRPANIMDVEKVVALKNMVAVNATGEPDNSVDQARAEWSRPSIKLETNYRVVETNDGQIIGYADVYQDPPQTAWLDIYVHPDHEADGIGEYLVQWGENLARENIALAPADARVAMQAWAYEQDTRWYQPMLNQFGFQVIRHSYRMIIDLDKPVDEPVFPEGIAVRTTEPQGDQRDVLTVVRASFKDHFGYTDEDFEKQYQEWREEWDPLFEPDLWWLAYCGDDLAAVCLCESHFADDHSVAWVSTLGVKREYRKQGLGRALLLTAFREFQKRGKRSVGLGVDASNLTGAVRLYENAGMRVWHRFDRLEKELRPGVEYATTTLET